MKIAFEGLDRLLGKLDKLSSKDLISDPMNKSCLMVEADAKKKCPVDDGQLRQSITYEISANGLTGVVGTNVEYAPYVHQGTGIYAVNGDGRKDRWSYQDEEGQWHSTIGQKPQPFLEKALDENKKEIRELFQTKLREEMRGK